jgi:hypothetical protein
MEAAERVPEFQTVRRIDLNNSHPVLVTLLAFVYGDLPEDLSYGTEVSQFKTVWKEDRDTQSRPEWKVAARMDQETSLTAIDGDPPKGIREIRNLKFQGQVQNKTGVFSFFGFRLRAHIPNPLIPANQND